MTGKQKVSVTECKVGSLTQCFHWNWIGNLAQIAYFYDPEVGNYYYGQVGNLCMERFDRRIRSESKHEVRRGTQ